MTETRKESAVERARRITEQVRNMAGAWEQQKILRPDERNLLHNDMRRIDEALAAIRAEQPPVGGHRANCHCCPGFIDSGCKPHRFEGGGHVLGAIEKLRAEWESAKRGALYKEGAIDALKQLVDRLPRCRPEARERNDWRALVRIHDIATGGAWEPEQYTDFRARDAIAAVEDLKAARALEIAEARLEVVTKLEDESALTDFKHDLIVEFVNELSDAVERLKKGGGE